MSLRVLSNVPPRSRDPALQLGWPGRNGNFPDGNFVRASSIRKSFGWRVRSDVIPSRRGIAAQ